ncbi:hypothetical protein [Photobacterium sp.]|uniref:hypothetical protein n=1 Tax=Photobacterium sp. TaxID=660 RepID=UPI00299D5920|nr:hypothetical protein [Photobacterium sp.]MDX1301078.1 hypothetical protein [Photobacterium sp.]
MANLSSNQALYDYVAELIPTAVDTQDDGIIIEAFRLNDIRHVCQAIRNIHTNEVEYQHLTLRFGGNCEQSVYNFTLSEDMALCLDIYSLYLAVKHITFQLDTFHPDVINDLVVPIQAETLHWPQGHTFIEQLYRHHQKAMRHIIPCLQLHTANLDQGILSNNLASLQKKAPSLWIDIHTPTEYLPFLEQCRPDAIKISQKLQEKENKSGLLPVIKFIRKHNIQFIAGRIASKNELMHFKLLGATYYFGYISDIPTSTFKKIIHLISDT